MWPLSSAIPARVLVVDAIVGLVEVGVVATEELAVAEAGTVKGLQKEIDRQSVKAVDGTRIEKAIQIGR